MSEPLAGIVVVDKPDGVTSHGVVARVRRLAGTRKVGHAGTLDPMATGVLVVGVNRATRLLGHLMLTEKGYDATVRLGVATTTDDAEGEVVATTPAGDVTEDAVRAALAAFVGEIDQVPTAVSAIKVDGKRAYQRVRDGEQVELKARRVTIHELVVGAVRPLTVTAEQLPAAAPDLPALPDGLAVVDVDLSVRCSSGTYVRAIARDLGAALGVGGHLTALRRTAVGPFDLAAARTLDELGEEFQVVPMADVARACFTVLPVDTTTAADVRVGRPVEVPADLAGEPPYALIDPEGTFLALYEPRDERLKPVAVFV